VIATMLVELLLAPVNAFLQSGAELAWSRQPAFIACVGLGIALLGIVAGIYPAFVLSAFRPISAIKARVFGLSGGVARQVLVSLQFAILIGLVISAGVVYQQRVYATHAALRLNTDQILIVRSACTQALKNQLMALRGVRGAVCSDGSLLTAAAFGNFQLRDGSSLAFDIYAVELGVFDLYGVQPLAGRLPSMQDGDLTVLPASGYVINETARRRLGFASPAAAIGQPIPLAVGGSPVQGSIIGVTSDFSINAVAEQQRPAIYARADSGNVLVGRRDYTLINIKLSGRDIPETLAAVDGLWRATGSSDPIDRFFLNDYIQSLYVSVLREDQALGASAAIAVLIACLGLAGLAASVAERRTKEIGIRKAMGASTNDVLRLLLWQFLRPVLWSVMIAWVIAGVVMNHWLQGFAYHVELDPWLFVASAVLGLGIALLTVSFHCYLVARARPVEALRHE
jgi:putative ABC transport system permease protein